MSLWIPVLVVIGVLALTASELLMPKPLRERENIGAFTHLVHAWGNRMLALYRKHKRIMTSELFDLEYVNADGCEVITEINKQQLDVLFDAGVVKLSADSTAWVLNEDSEHYNVALVLLSIGDE